MVAVVSALIAAGFSYQAEQRQAHRADLQATVVELNEVRQATRLVGDDLAFAPRIANHQKPDLSRGMARTLRRIYVEISEARALIDPG
jgi:hypothetical protein